MKTARRVTLDARRPLPHMPLLASSPPAPRRATQRTMSDAGFEHSLYARFAGRILGYGLRHLRDPQLAQDLVQQVLLIVLQALRDGRIEATDKLESYVLGTCRNAVMDARRGV